MTAREEVLRELAVELLAALKAEHAAIDTLLAQRAYENVRDVDGFLDRKYWPTASPVWPTVEKGAQVMKKARAILGGSGK